MENTHEDASGRFIFLLGETKKEGYCIRTTKGKRCNAPSHFWLKWEEEWYCTNHIIDRVRELVRYHDKKLRGYHAD